MTIVSLHGFSSRIERQTYLLPKGSRILSVCVKQEHIYISVEHDANAKMLEEPVEFVILKEGRRFNVEGYHFLGTIVLDFGNTIYQVFYRKNKE